MDTRKIKGTPKDKIKAIALAIVEAKERNNAPNAKAYREAYEKQYGKS